jgi:drug/metabolite transporter (DMT)-like permease
MSQLSSYAVLILIGVAGATGDATLSRWAATRSSHWLLISYFLWGVTATLFGLVLRNPAFTFSASVVLALLMHCVVAVVIDREIFGARINGWHWLGIALACSAMFCIEVGRSTSSAIIPNATETP